MTVTQLVAAEQRRLRTRLLVAGGALAAGAALGLIALGTLALGDARWLSLPRALPIAIWVVVAGAAAVVAWRARAAVRRDASVGPVAAAIERERDLRAGEVRGALEVAHSGALGAFAAEQVARRLGDGGSRPTRTLAPSLQRRAERRAAAAGGVVAVAALAFAGSLAFARDGAAALLHPADAWRGTLLPPLRFDGLPREVVRGERLRVRVDAPGRREVQVAYRVTGREWETATVAVDARGGASIDLGTLDADVLVAATDGRATADTARVAVTERAFVGDVAVRAEYPAYLGRAAEPLPSGETVRVPRGTVLAVSGRASTALSEVALADARGATVLLGADGHRFAGRVIAEASGRWSWRARGAAGPIADVPAPMELDVLADSLPRVDILAPVSDSTVDGLAPVRVALAASDDHGLAAVALRVWRVRADGVREAASETRLAGGVPLWSGAANIDLAARSLQPGDKLHVQAVAVDGSPWRQRGASRELVLRVPSASELRAQARAAADTAVARATATAQAQRDLAQRTGDAARSREMGPRNERSEFQGTSSRAGGDKASMSYEAAERAKGLAKEQRQLADRVESLQDQAKALERQLKQAGALDSSLAQQLADVQRLLRDAMTPELAQQLQNLEQNANKLSGPEARASLEQLAAQQRALRQQLEKSVEMLRRAALEGAMQTLRDEAKELAQAETQEAQRMANESRRDSAGTAPDDAQQRAQERATARELADRSRELTKDVEDLTKRLRQEKADVGAQRAQEAGKHADASADAMERAARQTASAQQQRGEQQRAEQQRGEQRQAGQQQAGQQQGGQEQQGGQQQQGAQQQGAQQQGGQQQSGQKSGQQQGAQQNAQQAASEMQRAADQLAAARQGQIDAWKNDLSAELDRAIQETMQMAREQAEVEKQARSGAEQSSVRSAQGAVQQGVDQMAQRLDEAGRKSSLLSQRAQRAVGEARQQVAEASRELQQGQPGQQGQQGQQGGPQSAAANAMREAGEALNRAAAALVRDRERVNGAQSASGFEEMIAQMRELAKQQGQINQQAQGLPMPMPGQSGGAGREAARQLARQQRGVAEKLDDLGDADPTGRSDALAKEARQLAQQLERVGADPQTAQRQQQLYKRLLDAGRTLEQDERDESGKREAKTGAGVTGAAPNDGPTSGRGATRFEAPDWTQLRGLSAEERRLVVEYFRRLNAAPGSPQ